MASWITHRVQATTIGNVEGTREQMAAVNELERDFTISAEKLREVAEAIKVEMMKGLEKDNQTVPMVPSFVPGRLTGKETGSFLALDLGGTNLRVCQVNLLGDGKFTLRQEKFTVSEPLRTGPAQKLFDYLAECVDTYLTNYSSEDPQMPHATKLGFTFSFAVNQTAINRGTLLYWTKGFNCSGMDGKDIVGMLQDALLRKNVSVEVVALVNDTVGTLIAQSYREPDTVLGVILGTGTNGAYYEKVSNIKKLSGGNYSPGELMAVNTEWGAFDMERHVLPVTPYDNKLDRKSVNPRSQTYEKMISGMYLGEIVRNAVLHLVDCNLLFEAHSSVDLNRLWSFDSSYMSTIEADATPDLAHTQHVLESILNVPKTTLTDRRIVKKIVELVGTRAARLAAAGLVAVVEHCDALEEGCSVGIDGSLFQHYPSFRERIVAALHELVGDNADRIKLIEAADGSGIGAAMIACLASVKK
ncbi:uncharacterized protein VTP21DRAFT_3075 [Calcarisporiella thermophila]|uniref:uncharacterized protein n=1 Tax=Calcarisporiella thermophila TaxID=911321 RepID=UPI003742E080